MKLSKLLHAASQDSFKMINTTETQPPTIGIVVGEASGDLLGQSIMYALKKHYPELRFIGVGGQQMLKEGMKSLGDIETLSVMGLIEPLKKLPQILKLRKNIIHYFKKNPPLCFIGIDAPDFNLGLEKKLKNFGIKTVHLVSPTIWAWRENRIHTIKKAVDLMLLIYPFEKAIYEQHNMPASYIGHPLADSLSETAVTTEQARASLNLSDSEPCLAIMPGSREAEIRYLGNDFLTTAVWLRKKIPTLQIIIPCVNQNRLQQVQHLLEAYPELQDAKLILDNSVVVMQASDAILLASGTAALQAALLKKPCVVAYRVSGFTYQIAKRLIKLKYASIPNIIAQKEVIPEFIQNDVDPIAMGEKLLGYLQHSKQHQFMFDEFEKLTKILKHNAGERAAEVLLEFLEINTTKSK